MLGLPADHPQIALLVSPIGEHCRAVEDRAFSPNKSLAIFRRERDAAINARLKIERGPNRGRVYDGGDVVADMKNDRTSRRQYRSRSIKITMYICCAEGTDKIQLARANVAQRAPLVRNR